MWSEFSGITFQEIGAHLTRIAMAYILALPTAFNRERKSRGAGLRTFPLVAIGACGYMLVGQQVLENTDAHSRVIYGVITGIGFIGGGSVLKSRNSIHGTATAAGIWIMGAMGIAVAWQRYEIAIVLSVISFLTLSIGSPVKGYVHSSRENSSPDDDRGD